MKEMKEEDERRRKTWRERERKTRSTLVTGSLLIIYILALWTGTTEFRYFSHQWAISYNSNSATYSPKYPFNLTSHSRMRLISEFLPQRF
jgi:hypothetical protein